MVEKFRTIECYEESSPQYERVPETKDRAHSFFWMACCFCSTAVPGESNVDSWNIENCIRIDCYPEKEDLIQGEVSVVPALKLSPRQCYQDWNAQEDARLSPVFVKGLTSHSQLSPCESESNLPENPSVDGVAETQVFWEALLPKGWQTYVPKINRGIEKVYQQIRLADVDKITENYKKNWWRDNKFDDMFVYRCKYYQISPLFMLQRNSTTGRVLEIRRRKVELHSKGFRIDQPREDRGLKKVKKYSTSGSHRKGAVGDQSLQRQKSKTRKCCSHQTAQHSKHRIYRTSDLSPKSKRSKFEEKGTRSPKSVDNLRMLNYKNWQGWSTSDVLTWLRSIDFHQYCDAFKEKRMLGHELALVGKTYLVTELGMTVDHANQFLSAFKRVKSIYVSPSAIKVGYTYGKPVKSNVGSKGNINHSRSHECLFPEIEFAGTVVKPGHAKNESLVLQYREQEDSDSSVLSSMSGAPQHLVSHSIKSTTDDTIFSKNKTFSESWPQDMWNVASPSRHKYPLGEASSMTKTPNENSAQFFQWQEHYRGNDHFISRDKHVTDDEKIVLLAIPELKIPNNDEKTEQSGDYQRSTDEEKICHELYKGEGSGIDKARSRNHDSFTEDSNDCYKEPPKFILAGTNDREETDVRFDKRSTKQSSFVEKGESTSKSPIPCTTSTPLVSQDTSNPIDRSAYIERMKNPNGNTNSGLYGESPRLTFASKKKRLNEWEDMDDDIKALFAVLKATTISFKSSVLDGNAAGSELAEKGNTKINSMLDSNETHELSGL